MQQAHLGVASAQQPLFLQHPDKVVAHCGLQTECSTLSNTLTYTYKPLDLEVHKHQKDHNSWSKPPGEPRYLELSRVELLG